jgi:hypothetical protein
MKTKTLSKSPDPAALVDSLDSGQIAAQLSEAEGQVKALRALLRVARARERRPTARPAQGAPDVT